MAPVTGSGKAAAVQAPSLLRPIPLTIAAVALIAVVALVLTLPRMFRSGPGGPAAVGAAEVLAVMPFENLKEADDPQRLGQILQELIITDLSGLESLGVFSSQRLLDVHKQIAGGEERTEARPEGSPGSHGQYRGPLEDSFGQPGIYGGDRPGGR